LGENDSSLVLRWGNVFIQFILVSREAEELIELRRQLSQGEQFFVSLPLSNSTSLITMTLLLTPPVWILMLAMAYLFVVYGLLWWAQRLGKASKRRSIF